MENGHHNTKYETAPFDKRIIELTEKTFPKFLFIGLANKYPDYYFEVMNGIYRGMYGCETEYLTYNDMMRKTYKIPALALDNAALEVVNGKARILSLENGAVAKRCYWKKGIYVEEDIPTGVSYD